MLLIEERSEKRGKVLSIHVASQGEEREERQGAQHPCCWSRRGVRREARCSASMLLVKEKNEKRGKVLSIHAADQGEEREERQGAEHPCC
jgi:hypothetical protein